MNSLISRADAIEAWDKLSKRGRTEFDQVLMTLPSDEAEWIPCSEKLPENSGRYIVTLKDSWAITVRVAVYGVMPHDTHNKKSVLAI